MSASPAVAVIVLNWNGLEDTRACLASLAAQTYPALRMIVVDNASEDGSGAILAREFPAFTHVPNSENLGFTGGNNAAIANVITEGDTDFVLLLNNDATLAPDAVAHLVEAAQSDPRAGMVGPKIFYADPPDLLWYAGGAINFGERFPFRHIGDNEPDQGQYDTPGETDFLTGCCLLVRAETVRGVGMLDPAFGYYGEDVDWCLRAKQAGWQMLYEPRARAWHRISRSMARGSVQRFYYAYRNAALIARRHLAPKPAAGAVWRAGAGAALHHYHFSYQDKAERRALLEGAWHAVSGRTGLAASGSVGAAPFTLLLDGLLYPPTWLLWRLRAFAKRRSGRAEASRPPAT